jgi:hypothetical protein
MAAQMLSGVADAGVVTANPAADFTAAISVNLGQVQSFTRTSYFDLNTPSQIYPEIYWFKYTADGNSRVKFDTLGSDFGTFGPGNPSSSGPVLGSYNQSQIAVYRANGSLVAISKGITGLDGNPIPQYPTYTNNPSNRWYAPQGLSEVTFGPNPGANPHWSASPTDPTPHTGWSAPGNEGNGQRYYTPYYRTNLNEYQAWNTSLSSVVLDASGQPVINPDTGQPYSQPGWRYYDRARMGPASSWNRFDTLAAGEYYVAVTSPRFTFAGDLYTEEVLRYPAVGALSGPLGTWQYYVPGAGSAEYWGTIKLNVTHMPLVDPAWNANTNGTWSVGANWTSNTAPGGDNAGATFGNAISSPRTVSLDADRALSRLTFNSSQSYTIAGSSTLTLFDNSGTVTVDALAGSHTILAPVVSTSSVRFNVASPTLSLVLQDFRPSQLLIAKAGPGTLGVNKLDAFSVDVQGGKLKFTGDRIAGRTTTFRLASGASLDLGRAGFVVDYSVTSPIVMAVPTPALIAQIKSGQIFTSDAALRVGYAEATSLALTAFLGQTGLDSTAFVMRATLAGDATLDGTVNFDDLLKLAAAYNGTGKAWIEGDFNYDGTTNFDDLLLLAANYNQSVSIAPGDGAWSSALLASPIPEPASFATLALLSMGSIARRRRG